MLRPSIFPRRDPIFADLQQGQDIASALETSGRIITI
jgi:hypothetical protein